MANALAAFIKARMNELGLRQRDVMTSSGLSRSLVWKYASDDRDELKRLPDRATLAGFAKALGVPVDVLIGKAVQSLPLGYTAGDFVNAVATASDRDLLGEIERRLAARGGEERVDGSATNTQGDENGSVLPFPSPQRVETPEQPVEDDDEAAAHEDEEHDTEDEQDDEQP